MRKRLYEIIEVAKDGDVVSTVYDALMLCTIVVSIIPLAFKNQHSVFTYMDAISTVIFIIDYLFRWGTADYKLGKKSVVSFIRYPFTPWAVIDLISILPGVTLLSNGFRLFRLFRIFRTFRVFKAFRYSRSIIIIVHVIRKSKEALIAVCTLALGYIIVSALIVFNVEGDTLRLFLRQSIGQRYL